MQIKVELVLSNYFKVLCFVGKIVRGGFIVVVRGIKMGCVIGLRILCCQIDVVCIVFQVVGVDCSVIVVIIQVFVSSVVLIGSMFRCGDSVIDREVFVDCISQ